MRELTDAEPDNVGWRRDLAVSCGKVGDAYRLLRDSHFSLHYYEESAAICARLAFDYPDTVEWQRDRSVAQTRLAAARQAKGDFPVRSRPTRMPKISSRDLLPIIPTK